LSIQGSTFGVRGSGVRDTNVSNLGSSVTKHMIHSRQDLNRVMTRLWQVAGKPRSSSCQKIGCSPSRIMRIFAFRHPWAP